MSKSNTPTARTTRSSSTTSSSLTLVDIKNLIESSTKEIMDSLKNEIKEISNNLSHLQKKVNELESRNVQLEQRCNQLESKSLNFSATILDEMEDRLRRKKNLIISGIPEQTEGSVEERMEADKTIVKDLLESLCGMSDDDISRSHRIGRQQPDKNRLIRVVLSNEDDKKNVLYNAKQLRSMPSYKNVYVNPDLTPSQRESNKLLHEELKRRRDLGNDVVIRGGKVVSRSRAQNFL